MRFKKLPIVENVTISIKLYAKFRKYIYKKNVCLGLRMKGIHAHVPVDIMIFFSYIYFFYKGQINLSKLQVQNVKLCAF